MPIQVARSQHEGQGGHLGVGTVDEVTPEQGSPLHAPQPTNRGVRAAVAVVKTGCIPWQDGRTHGSTEQSVLTWSLCQFRISCILRQRYCDQSTHHTDDNTDQYPWRACILCTSTNCYVSIFPVLLDGAACGAPQRRETAIPCSDNNI